VKTRAGCHIQNLLGAAFLELIDKETTFALGAAVPVDEFVPFIDKAVDVFLLITFGMTHRHGVVA
jgi:hypothetical protein